MISKPLALFALLFLSTSAFAQDTDLSSAASAAGSGPIDDTVAPQSAIVERGLDVDEGQGGDLYCRRKLGTWFYCDKPKAKPRAADPATPPPPQQSAATRIKEIGVQLDELKARAILEPSSENVIAYIRFQRQQLDRSSTFADVWQRAIWQTPDLDYTLQRPVSTVGKRLWVDNRAAARSAAMAKLSQRYGLFYFYAQSCAACEIQSPILKSLSDSNRLSVVAVSMDGGPNRVFPNYVVDTGQRVRMGLRDAATPALVLFDTVTKRPIPIGAGLMAADEIIDRIFVLTNTKPGSDY